MIHTVIFDVGGTLVNARSIFATLAERLDPANSATIFKSLRNNFMALYRAENPPKFIMVKDIIAIVLKMAAVEFKVDDLSSDAHRLYSEIYINNAKVFDDVHPTLKKLRQNGLKMIVASDADADVLKCELTTFDLHDYFDHILISSEIKSYKPSDNTVRVILEYCEKPYSDILFVGDTIADIRTATKMNARSVLISRNGDFTLDADYRISDMRELFDIISDIEKEAG